MLFGSRQQSLANRQGGFSLLHLTVGESVDWYPCFSTQGIVVLRHCTRCCDAILKLMSDRPSSHPHLAAGRRARLRRGLLNSIFLFKHTATVFPPRVHTLSASQRATANHASHIQELLLQRTHNRAAHKIRVARNSQSLTILHVRLSNDSSQDLQVAAAGIIWIFLTYKGAAWL